MREHMTNRAVRYDTPKGPLEVSFNHKDRISVQTPSNCGTYPELQYVHRGVGYQVAVHLPRNEAGGFSTDTRGEHVYISVVKMNASGLRDGASASAYRAILADVDALIVRALAADPLAPTRGERAYTNNEIMGLLAKRADLQAQINGVQSMLEGMGEREEAAIRALLPFIPTPA